MAAWKAAPQEGSCIPVCRNAASVPQTIRSSVRIYDAGAETIAAG
jgi:hypothetical protein